MKISHHSQCDQSRLAYTQLIRHLNRHICYTHRINLVRQPVSLDLFEIRTAAMHLTVTFPVTVRSRFIVPASFTPTSCPPTRSMRWSAPITPSGASPTTANTCSASHARGTSSSCIATRGSGRMRPWGGEGRWEWPFSYERWGGRR